MKVTYLARSLVLTGSTLVSVASLAIPVIPGASGFGIETPAGRGGAVYRVTTLADSGSGSLRECIAASGPRVCVFEVSGVIRLTDDLKVWNPNLTIAGQTAPAPGIMLRGAGLRIHASDVLVQHIALRAGDDPAGPAPGNRDSLEIDNTDNSLPPVRNVVIDHCSISWGIDENVSVSHSYDNVTFRHNIIAEPLADSGLISSPQGYAVLIDASSGRISLVGNLIANYMDRGPLSRAGQLAFVNNVVYNFASGTDIQNQKGITTLNSIVGNVYRRGPGVSYVYEDILVNGGTYGPVLYGTKVHVSDNMGSQPGGSALTSDPWSIVRNDSTLTRNQVEAPTPPTWPAGLVALKTTSNAVFDHVLSRAGARPTERNSVDARIISNVRNGTGQIVNCVSPGSRTQCSKNAGGWPTYAENRRSLSLPANPSGDDDRDGYTNLEEYLHQMATALEGAPEVRPEPPVMVVK